MSAASSLLCDAGVSCGHHRREEAPCQQTNIDQLTRHRSRPDGSSGWQALPWYVVVILGTLLLATGELPLHLTAALQRLATIAVAAESVLFLPAGFILILAAMRRNPTTSRSSAWGRRLLVTGLFGGGVIYAYGFVTGLLPQWQRSNTELLVLAVLGALMFVLFSLGLLLMVVALIGGIWQSVRSRYRRPPATSGS